jgi:hypothetical protein
LPIDTREIPGTYVMNLGRAADTLIVEAGGKYRRIYAFPGRPVIIDSGTWAITSYHGDEVVVFTNFWQRWRAETEGSGSARHRAPITLNDWRPVPERSLWGRLQLPVEPDLQWTYERVRR